MTWAGVRLTCPGRGFLGRSFYPSRRWSFPSPAAVFCLDPRFAGPRFLIRIPPG
jgi:hypothetical protein